VCLAPRPHAEVRLRVGPAHEGLGGADVAAGVVEVRVDREGVGPRRQHHLGHVLPHSHEDLLAVGSQRGNNVGPPGPRVLEPLAGWVTREDRCWAVLDRREGNADAVAGDDQQPLLPECGRGRRVHARAPSADDLIVAASRVELLLVCSGALCALEGVPPGGAANRLKRGGAARRAGFRGDGAGGNLGWRCQRAQQL
jgi:hypothetical protein